MAVGDDLLLVAVEVGTTGARAVAVDLEGRVVAEVRRPYPTTTPRPGWAEQSALDWAERAVEALAGLVREVPATRIGAIGLTGQSPTVVPVDARCRPLRPGLLYRDNRAVEEAAEMRDRFGERAIHARSGHRPEAFHVGPKVLWLRRHEPAVFAKARWFLQPRDVVLHRLTGAVLTDESHADATLFFDLAARCWAVDLLAELDLDPAVFPPAQPSWTTAGTVSSLVAAETGIAAGTPVVLGAGDSQCAAFGAGVVDPGPVSEMAGASSCLNSAVTRPRRDVRITHYSHVVPDRYTTEVGLNTTGGAIAWAVRELGFGSYEELAAQAAAGRQALRASAEDPLDAAPVLVPHLGDGERDDPDARGAVIGLSDRHDRADLALAVVEGVAIAVAGRVRLLRRAGCPVDELRVAGGGARLDVLGQLKADHLGVPVRHLDVDASAVGAALLAAPAAGLDGAADHAVDAVLARARRFDPDPTAPRWAPARAEWAERAGRGAGLSRGARRRHT